jgi:hypothetical protein
MKKLTLRMMAFAALQGSALLAQNIIGNWQGTLQAGPQKVRIVFKIALENDKLKATLYTVDRPSAPIATTITWDSSTVKMTTPALHGNYEGKLGGDGNSIAGTWTQGAPLALNLARATPETAWAIQEPLPPPVRMAANANAAFEVATIKPSDPARPGQVVTLRGGRYHNEHDAARSDQLGLLGSIPSSLPTDRPGRNRTSTPDGKAGCAGPAKRRPDEDDDSEATGRSLPAQIPFREERSLGIRDQDRKNRSENYQERGRSERPSRMEFRKNCIGNEVHLQKRSTIASRPLLQNSLDKPVVDQSGLSERYDFTLTFTPMQLRRRLLAALHLPRPTIPMPLRICSPPSSRSWD